ncbi:hypothetical protein MMC20_007398 [Loxospora ochrophaea]|nr:hypothetical protein [Loxospora ochrophaea]
MPSKSISIIPFLLLLRPLLTTAQTVPVPVSTSYGLGAAAASGASGASSASASTIPLTLESDNTTESSNPATININTTALFAPYQANSSDYPSTLPSVPDQTSTNGSVSCPMPFLTLVSYCTSSTNWMMVCANPAATLPQISGSCAAGTTCLNGAGGEISMNVSMPGMGNITEGDGFAYCASSSEMNDGDDDDDAAMYGNVTASMLPNGTIYNTTAIPGGPINNTTNIANNPAS